MLVVLVTMHLTWISRNTPRAVVQRPAARIHDVIRLAEPGDLEGGTDPERNLRIASLKRLFYSASASESPLEPLPAQPPATAEDLKHIGVVEDVPLCRWPWEILPHHQRVLVVHEPEYTHMFESILAAPQPHIYMHLLLPGGTDNLANPEYALAPGTKSPLVGTLMQVVATLRESNSRLVLVVQGVARAVVLRPTQMKPYSRADVQEIPPDLPSSGCITHPISHPIPPSNPTPPHPAPQFHPLGAARV